MRATNDAERVLADLLAAGAIPVVEDGRLRIEAPRGALDASRRREVEAALPELRAIVAGRYRSREACVARRPCRRMSVCAKPADGRPCRMPATCCLCGAPLPSGETYVCRACGTGDPAADDAHDRRHHGGAAA